MHNLMHILTYVKTGAQPFSIDRQIASGCSSYVYSATAFESKCIVKELYPERLLDNQLLGRNAHGRVVLRNRPTGMYLWLQSRRRFLKAAGIALALQNDPGISPYVVNLRYVYIGNGTIYTVTEGLDGCAWDQITDITPEQILMIGCRIAHLCQELHRRKWLLVDIKASNFLLDRHPDGTFSVRLTDFDSLLPFERIRHQKCFFCSSETAPPELIASRRYLIGTHSDVYSICAMLLRKLGGELNREHIREVFVRQISPRLVSWTQEQQELLLALFLRSLELDPYKRLDSCRVLSEKLYEILMQRGVDYENIQ